MDLLRKENYTLTEWTEKKNLPQDQLIRLCKDHDALISVGGNKLDRNFFDECANLKAVSLMSAGYDSVDVSAATTARKAVGFTPGVLSAATADVAFLLMLAVSRNAFYMYQKIVKGEWGFHEPTADLGFELYGKTVGIFGLGDIGIHFARKCVATYGMRVIYHNRNRNIEAERELNALYVSFDELLAESDVLSVHAGLSSATKGIFDMKAFSKMKSASIFINAARGAIHNEEDLKEALKRGVIHGAGLDVTNPEPMERNNELLFMPNVCVLPHIGSATVETRSAMSVLAARNIIHALHGLRMPNCINPEVYND